MNCYCISDSNDKKEEIEKSSKKTKVETKAKSVKTEKKNTTEDVKKVVTSVKQSNVGIDLATYLDKERSNVYEKLEVEDEVTGTLIKLKKKKIFSLKMYNINLIGAGIKENDAEPKEDSSKKKNRNRKKKKTEVDVTVEKPKEDEFDNVLAEFSKSNYVCAFESCKVSTKLIHLACEFCSKWYCLQHGQFISELFFIFRAKTACLKIKNLKCKHFRSARSSRLWRSSPTKREKRVSSSAASINV